MIQLDILSGTKAGTRWVAPALPARVGREREAALSLADDGVWEGHLELSLRPGAGCLAVPVNAEAPVLVNGGRVLEPTRLRNGDLIELGAVKLRFGLSPTRSSTMLVRETLTWVAIGLLCAGQLAAIYFLLP